MNQHQPLSTEGYDHQALEGKWQKLWQAKPPPGAEDFSNRTKKYLLVEYPYPSGDGLHVGHIRSYAAFDALARFYRMQGENVLYPIGWDAFGLPTENYALKTGIHPRQATDTNIANFRRQMQSLGLSFDWPREIDTTDPKYYKWTQWIFLQLFKKGLAYQATIPINWCPSCQIGLANEEVVAGKCERCGAEVVRRLQKQWMLKITAYADRLLKDLDTVDYLPKIKTQQVNWIGKSEGAEIKFEVKSEKAKVSGKAGSGSAGKKEKLRFVLLHGFETKPDEFFLPWLKRELESRGHEVIIPELPNPNQPTENEQVNFVLQNVQFDENTVLFGHSLGAVVALKVAERLKTKISGLVLAGGFLKPKFRDKPRPFQNTFDWTFDFKKIRQNTGFIRSLSALNDSRVPREASLHLAAALGVKAEEVHSNGDHFKSENEPALLEVLTPSINVFTTRPDTLFGATYLVLSPEHPLIESLSPTRSGMRIENYREVEKYIQKAAKKSDLDRTDLAKDKTGVELKGIQAVNPANNEPIPIWVADYVLMSYGTGAIMAVPGHDERDYEFAQKFKLPVRYVVEPKFTAKPDGESAIKPGEPFVKRQAVCAIVRNSKTDKYLCISWKTTPMHGLVTGGIDDDEDLIEAARREVLEETGYKNLKLVKVSPVAIHSLFYHRVKQQNRWARFQYVFFDLKNEECDPVNEKEAALHEVLWLSKEEMKNFFTVVEGEFVLKLIESPDYVYTGHGVLMNSGDNNWLDSEAYEKLDNPVPPNPLEAVVSAGAFGYLAPDQPKVVQTGELLPGNFNGLDSAAGGRAIVEWLSYGKSDFLTEADVNIGGAGVLLETKNGTYLFQEREERIKLDPGMIGPFGGAVESDETAEENICRELKEELELNIRPHQLEKIGIFPSRNTPGFSHAMFSVRNVKKDDLILHEGKRIVELSAEDALKNEKVTEFTKNVIRATKKYALPSARFTVQYKLRDWVFSRQHYWGEPIPIVHCPDHGAVPVPEDQLPVELPYVEKYQPSGTGESPLASVKDWVNTKCPQCGQPAKKETDTMPNWAGSSWYYLRYCDPKNDKDFFKAAPDFHRPEIEITEKDRTYFAAFRKIHTDLEQKGITIWAVNRLLLNGLNGKLWLPLRTVAFMAFEKDLQVIDEYFGAEGFIKKATEKWAWQYKKDGINVEVIAVYQDGETLVSYSQNNAAQKMMHADLPDTKLGWLFDFPYRIVSPAFNLSHYRYVNKFEPETRKNLGDDEKIKFLESWLARQNERIVYWLPVDLYNGGMEHTTLHLLYSRFWHKFLFDQGLVPTVEPYQRRHSHGIVLAEDGRKMSKSFGNVINPDDYVREYGADALRMYEMFMGPFEDTIPWSTNGLVGARRFLNRVFDVFNALGRELKGENGKLKNVSGRSAGIHRVVKKVTEDLEKLRFNTTVSALMEYFNEYRNEFAMKLNSLGQLEGNAYDETAIRKFLILLYPMAPHLASELFEMLFGSDISTEKWPEYDSTKLASDTFQLVVQVNGKLRAKIEAPMGISETEAIKLVKNDSAWKRYMEGRKYRVVFVMNRLINFIVA